MVVQLKYFGMISEITGLGEEEISLSKPMNVLQMKTHLFNKYERLIEVNFQIGINEVIEKDNCDISDKDVIALLPPFSGG